MSDSDSDQDALVQALLDDGYAVDRPRNIVRAYVRSDHRPFTMSDHALENGYVMTGFKELDGPEFIGYVRFHPASSVSIAGYTIGNARDVDTGSDR